MKIKCKECHKVYEYPQDEVCPKCGAYNNPREGEGAVSPASSQVSSYPRTQANKNFTTGTQKRKTVPNKSTKTSASNRTSTGNRKKSKTPTVVGIIIIIVIFLINVIPRVLSRLEINDLLPSIVQEVGKTEIAEEELVPPVEATEDSIFTDLAEPEQGLVESSEESSEEEEGYKIPEEKVRVKLSGASIEYGGLFIEFRAIGDAIEPTEEFPFRYIFLDIKAIVTDRAAVEENVSYAFTPEILGDGTLYYNMFIENLTDLSEYSSIYFTDLEEVDEIEGQLFYCIPEEVSELSIYDISSNTQWYVGNYGATVENYQMEYLN